MVNLRQAAEEALTWIDERWPADVFDGSSGDEGPVRIATVREQLRAALAAPAPPDVDQAGVMLAAPAGKWQPVVNGELDDLTYIQNGTLHCETEIGTMEIALPAGFSVCQRVTAPAQPPDEEE